MGTGVVSKQVLWNLGSPGGVATDTEPPCLKVLWSSQTASPPHPAMHIDISSKVNRERLWCN